MRGVKTLNCLNMAGCGDSRNISVLIREYTRFMTDPIQHRGYMYNRVLGILHHRGYMYTEYSVTYSIEGICTQSIQYPRAMKTCLENI